MSSREEVLSRIRSAIRGGKPPTDADRQAAEDYIAARARGPIPVGSADLVAGFRKCCETLSSTVASVPVLDAVPAEVARYLAQAGLPRAGVCWPEFAALGWAALGLAVEGRPARGDDLVGITGAFCGIAETGTLMMLSSADTPAAASLLPETHIAVLPASRIVATMEDAWALLRSERGEPPRATNFVSGPSRTADIEQTVSLGAHGPYRVHIVLLES